MFVFELAQKPLLALFACTNQQPAALQAAVQLKLESSFCKRFDRIGLGRPAALVPDFDPARAVLPSRDLSFELCIFQWMIFYVNGQAFDRGVEGGPFGDGPTDEHPIYFETKIVVEASRLVALYDVAGTRRPFLFTGSTLRFRCHVKIALFAIGLQSLLQEKLLATRAPAQPGRVARRVALCQALFFLRAVVDAVFRLEDDFLAADFLLAVLLVFRAGRFSDFFPVPVDFRDESLRSSMLRCSIDMRSITFPDCRLGGESVSSTAWVRPDSIFSSMVAIRSSRYSSRYSSG